MNDKPISRMDIVWEELYKDRGLKSRVDGHDVQFAFLRGAIAILGFFVGSGVITMVIILLATR